MFHDQYDLSSRLGQSRQHGEGASRPPPAGQGQATGSKALLTPDAVRGARGHPQSRFWMDLQDLTWEMGFNRVIPSIPKGMSKGPVPKQGRAQGEAPLQREGRLVSLTQCSKSVVSEYHSVD